MLPDAFSLMEDDGCLLGSDRGQTEPGGAKGSSRSKPQTQTATSGRGGSGGGAGGGGKNSKADKFLKLHPTVAASKLRSQTLGAYNEIKGLLNKSVNQSRDLLVRLEQELVPEAFQDDRMLQLIQSRSKLVEMLSDDRVRNVPDQSELDTLIESDDFLRDSGVHSGITKSLGQLEYFRNIESSCQSTTEAVLSVFDAHSDSIAASKTIARAMILGVLLTNSFCVLSLESGVVSILAVDHSSTTQRSKD